MGMFDTFLFQSIIPCAECGAEITSTQSHSFGQMLNTYKPGDFIRGANIHYGIVEEDCYCSECTKRENRKRTFAFLAVWHGVYAGAYGDKEEALTRLAAVDRLSLLAWLDEKQTERDTWIRRFRNLRGAVDEWHDYDKAEDKEQYLKRPFLFMRSDLLEQIKSEDPLGAILKDHDFKAETESDIFG